MPRNKSKKAMQSVLPEREEVSQLATASSEMEDNDTDSDHGQEQTEETGLKELREFRKDSIQQLKEIHEEVDKTNTDRHGQNSDTSSQTWRAAPEERTSEYTELKRERRRNLHQWYVMLSTCYRRGWVSGTPLSCGWRELTAS